MILIDTSIWIDHFRQSDPILTGLLMKEKALTHPFVIGELALGQLRERSAVLKRLHDLPVAVPAADAEVQTLIERQKLYGVGIGYVDAHLLAATLLTSGAKLWTRDRRLTAAADRLEVGARLDQ